MSNEYEFKKEEESLISRVSNKDNAKINHHLLYIEPARIARRLQVNSLLLLELSVEATGHHR